MSRKLCQLIDNHILKVDKIELYQSNLHGLYRVIIGYDAIRVVYENTEVGGCTRSVMVAKTKIEGKSCTEMTLEFLSEKLKHPKMQIKRFCIEADNSNFIASVLKVLKSRKTILCVKEISIDGLEECQMAEMLSCVKPRTLEKIVLQKNYDENQTIELKEIVQLEQWKYAKELVTEFNDGAIAVRYQDYCHFDKISVKLARFPKEDFYNIRDVCKLCEFSNFKLIFQILTSRSSFQEAKFQFPRIELHQISELFNLGTYQKEEFEYPGIETFYNHEFNGRFRVSIRPSRLLITPVKQ